MVSFLESFGQVGKVRDQINTSFSCVRKSWSSANNALGEIQKCNIAISVNEVQFIAAKAKTEMEEAVLQAKNAELEADGAVGEAQNINCSGAEEVAGKAKKSFKKAKSKFDDAYTKLNNATDEDRIEYLIDYLNSTLRVIEDGMGYLKKGIDELNGTLGELENCK
jgi:predicted transcriptional regulator of viral defense system